MAHFAKLDENNIVLEVVVVNNDVLLDNNGIEQETNGINFLTQIYGHANWKQTSYNSIFRKNYADIGSKYDSDKNAFISTQPMYPVWTLNEETYEWELPDIKK